MSHKKSGQTDKSNKEFENNCFFIMQMLDVSLQIIEILLKIFLELFLTVETKEKLFKEYLCYVKIIKRNTIELRTGARVFLSKSLVWRKF